MPLTLMEIGEANIIQRISGADSVRRHLAELGLVVGEKVVVVGALGGSVILAVKDSRVALDRALAMRVLVG